MTTDYTSEQWVAYAGKLEEYATGDTKGYEGNLNYGTCRYCEYSEVERAIPAYELFHSLLPVSEAAQRLHRMYTAGLHGRIPERAHLAGLLANYIRKEILRA